MPTPVLQRLNTQRFGLADALMPPQQSLGEVLASLPNQPDPNELITRTERVTLPRWLWERLEKGELVWTDLRRIL